MGVVPRRQPRHRRGGHQRRRGDRTGRNRLFEDDPGAGRRTGVERARELNEFIEQGWPNYIERDIDEWAVLALLLQTHVREFWGSSAPGWNDALPVAETLWSRLTAGRAEVVALTTPPT